MASAKDRVKKEGLTVWADGGTDPEIDIILVQGLNAHPYYTWVGKPSDRGGKSASSSLNLSNLLIRKKRERDGESKDEVFWPNDLLPQHLPSARIATYSYSSNWTSKQFKDDLRDCGEHFLNVLHIHREGTAARQRPLLFVGHSLGGLVIQQALVLANHGDTFAEIRGSCGGSIFLGVPMHGSDYAGVIALAESVIGNNQPLLRSLKAGSRDLDSLSRDFWNSYKNHKNVVCFYETDESRYGLIKVKTVNQQSASLLIARRMQLATTHSKLNKFWGEDDEKYQQVLQSIKKVMDEALEDLEEQEEAARQSIDLSAIPSADGAAWNHRVWEHEDLCYPGTRVGLRHRVMQWAEDPERPPVFWLNGMAGTGKSTISRTIAKALSDNRQLGASFFFSRGRRDISHAGLFFPTIARQLAESLPTLRPAIAKAMETQSDILQRGLSEQWKHLILKPIRDLGSLPKVSNTLVIIIDALDECSDERDAKLILQLLADFRSIRTIQIRTFVTSRPELSIRLGFRRMPDETYSQFILHDIKRSVVDNDISIFFQHKLSDIKRDNDELLTPWPGDEVIEHLVTKAAGLFIYASTTCRYIDDNIYDPQEQLSIVLSGKTNQQSYSSQLDLMYTQILQRSLFSDKRNESEKDRLSQKFRKVVGSIVVMFDILPVKELGVVLHTTESEVSRILKSLHSVLSVPTAQDQPVKILHPSFRDFLLSKDRCPDQFLFVEEKQAHTELLHSCLRLMSERLRQDMCDLRAPGTLIGEVPKDKINIALSNGVRYACRYWARHLKKGNPKTVDYDLVYRFLSRDFLHWLECMCLLGDLADGVTMAQSLNATLKAHSLAHSNLSLLADDAERFTIYHRPMMEKSPLQIYCAALIFSPKESLIRKQYAKSFPWVSSQISEGYDNEWTPLLQTLEGRDNEDVDQIKFSSDGLKLATASHHADLKTVRLWDVSTGNVLASFSFSSASQQRDIQSIVFTRDDNRIAFGMRSAYPTENKSILWEYSVNIWNLETGRVRNLPCSHETGCFSADGTTVACASYDGNITLFDTLSGATISTIKEYRFCLPRLALSPDGKLLATLSEDGEVVLWYTAYASKKATCPALDSRICHFAFSPDSSLLAMKTSTETTFWNPDTLDLQCKVEEEINSKGLLRCHKLGDHEDKAGCMRFSPSGDLLAVDHHDRLDIWDTGAMKQRYRVDKNRYHSDFRFDISSNSHFLAVTGSRSVSSLVLWNLHTGVSRTVPTGSGQCSVVFSPDSRLIATMSYGSPVRIWDSGIEYVCPQNWSCNTQPDVERQDGLRELYTPGLQDTLTEIYDLILSPLRDIIAVTDPISIRLWDAITGSLLEFVSQPDYRHLLEFSLDNTYIAWTIKKGSQDTIVIWHIRTRQFHCELEGHSNRITLLKFSRDSKQLVSVSRGGMIKVWDIKTGANYQIPDAGGPYNNLEDISLGHDMLASLLDNREIRFWKMSTGMMIHVQMNICDCKGYYSSIVSSPRGTLVSYSCWHRVAVWETQTGKLKASIEVPSANEHEIDWINLAISWDDELVARVIRDSWRERSIERSIGVWNLETGVLTMKFDFGPTVGYDRFSWRQELYFSKDNTCLTMTRKGYQWNLDDRNPGLSAYVQNPLYIDQNWITCDGQKILCIPSEYRATGSIRSIRIYEIRQNTVVLLHDSGHPIILTFDLAGLRKMLKPQNLNMLKCWRIGDEEH